MLTRWLEMLSPARTQHHAPTDVANQTLFTSGPPILLACPECRVIDPRQFSRHLGELASLPVPPRSMFSLEVLIRRCGLILGASVTQGNSSEYLSKFRVWLRRPKGRTLSALATGAADRPAQTEGRHEVAKRGPGATHPGFCERGFDSGSDYLSLLSRPEMRRASAGLLRNRRTDNGQRGLSHHFFAAHLLVRKTHNHWKERTNGLLFNQGALAGGVRS